MRNANLSTKAPKIVWQSGSDQRFPDLLLELGSGVGPEGIGGGNGKRIEQKGKWKRRGREEGFAPAL